MAKLAIVYDPTDRIGIDTMPKPVRAAMMHIDAPPENKQQIKRVARQLAELLLEQID